jgi:phosphoglycolate phosphatase-like HAD superfamily hydrolase
MPILNWTNNDRFGKAIQNKSYKAILLDFDRTIFNTSADNDVRKNSKVKDWDLIYSKIPEYWLYDGWREVFSAAKAKNVKIAIISTAKKELIQRSLAHFKLDCDVVIGWQRCYQKPHPKIIEMALKKLNLGKDEVISIGDSVIDMEMSNNGGVKFIAAIWDSDNVEDFTNIHTISRPTEILNFL